MKTSTLLFIPTIALAALTNFPTPTQATPQLLTQRLPQSHQTIQIQRSPSRRTPARHQPTNPSGPILQAPSDGGLAITCVNGTCYCNGNDDCDALFTSTKCVPGTETTSPDDESGQCTQND